MPRNLYRQSFVEEIRHLIRCIRGEVTCLAPGEEALQTKRLLRAIYESARERREVRVA
jgi:predicted dehydrogenase